MRVWMKVEAEGVGGDEHDESRGYTGRDEGRRTVGVIGVFG